MCLVSIEWSDYCADFKTLINTCTIPDRLAAKFEFSIFIFRVVQISQKSQQGPQVAGEQNKKSNIYYCRLKYLCWLKFTLWGIAWRGGVPYAWNQCINKLYCCLTPKCGISPTHEQSAACTRSTTRCLLSENKLDQFTVSSSGGKWQKVALPHVLRMAGLRSPRPGLRTQLQYFASRTKLLGPWCRPEPD